MLFVVEWTHRLICFVLLWATMDSYAWVWLNLLLLFLLLLYCFCFVLFCSAPLVGFSPTWSLERVLADDLVRI